MNEGSTIIPLYHIYRVSGVAEMRHTLECGGCVVIDAVSAHGYMTQTLLIRLVIVESDCE